MAVRVDVGDDRVEIELDGRDRLLALKRRLTLELTEVVAARVVSRDEARRDLGWRLGGGYWPGTLATGHYTTKGRKGVRQLWCVYRAQQVLVIETRLHRPWRVVLEHPDAEALADAIGERLGTEPGRPGSH